MKLFGREVRAAYGAVGVAASAALILGVALYPTQQQEEKTAIEGHAGRRRLTEDGEVLDGKSPHAGRKLMTEAEIDAFQENEMLTAEEMDINATESDEIDRLFTEMDTISEMIEATTAGCIEDASGPNPEDVEYDFDFNATEVTVPCGDEVEIEDLELQLAEVQMELTTYLDAEGLDGLGSDAVYDRFVEHFQKPGDINAIPDDAALTKETRKAAFKNKVKKTNEHNAKAMAAKAKIKANNGKANGKGKIRNLKKAEDEEEEADTSIEVINKFSDIPEETFDEYYYADNEMFFQQGHDEEVASGNVDDGVDRRALSEADRRALSDHMNQESFTWKGTPQMGRVVNQGSCGSCYLNAVVTEFETALAIATGESPLELSREQIKNCQYENWRTTSHSPRGCNGGWMANSYEYIRRNWNAHDQVKEKGGLTLDSSYPYVASNRICAYDEGTMPKRAILGDRDVARSSYKYISGSETRFKEALKDGPITVALGASCWGGYNSGVKTCGSCQRSINHAVTLVGWGVASNGQKYWEIQNSWGTWWGDGGFMKIYRGLNSDGSDRSSAGWRGDKGCGMTVYGGWQSKFPAKYDPNVVDCQGSFSAWSECSDKCEGGYQTATYSITQAKSGTGARDCPYTAGFTKYRKCKYTEEVVQDWGQCSKECNGGEEEKHTRVQSDDDSCTMKIQKRKCNTHLCPNTCLVVSDGPYSWINGNYRPGTGTNSRDRCTDKTNPYYLNDKSSRYGRTQIFWYGRSCTKGYWVVYTSRGNRGWMWSDYTTRGTTPLGVKSWWNNRNKMKIDAVDCDSLPVDCEYQWDKEWSSCSADCDGGTMTLGRTIFQEEANGGKACPAVKTKACNTHSCSAKCLKVQGARYRFLDGVYQGQAEGYQQSFCGNGETNPRYTKTVVRKYWWRTYTYKYDLAFYNNKCSYKYNGWGSNPRWTYIPKGGDWQLGRIYKWGSRTYMSAWDRSPYSWSRYIKTTDSRHPKNMDWALSARMTDDWYRKDRTTVVEVPCES